MASTITAGNSTNGGLTSTADTTGALQIRTGTGAGTTAISIDASQNVVVTGSLSATGGITGGIPTGAVFWFAANTAPSGYLEASGAAVSRATYAALFAVVGTTFGAGDGSTTFNLPNLRGQFIRGWDNGAAVDPGRVFGSSQVDAFASHTHTAGTSTAAAAPGGASVSVRGVDTGGVSTSAAGGTETRPKNVALLPCIKT